MTTLLDVSRRSVTRALSLCAALLIAAALAVPALAAAPTPEAPVPQTINDTAGLLDAGTIRTATLVADRIDEITGQRLLASRVKKRDPNAAGHRGQRYVIRPTGLKDLPETLANPL